MNSKSFQHECTIRFDQADLAGIMFFGQVYFLAHEVFEKFVLALGFQWREWFANSKWGAPIRHSEASYLKPMLPGQTYQVTLSVQSLGDSSIQLHYRFAQGTTTHCEVKMVHAFLDIATKCKMTIPPEVRAKLEPLVLPN